MRDERAHLKYERVPFKFERAQFPLNILHGLDSGWTWADLGLPYSSTAQTGWAEGGKVQVQPMYLCSPTLPRRARLGMLKQLIGLTMAGACPST